MKCTTRPTGSSPRSGVALLWAMFMVIIAGGSAFVMVTLGASAKRVADTDRNSTLARSLSRGASVFGEQALADAVRQDFAVPAGGVASLDGIDTTWTLAQATAPVQNVAGSGLSSYDSTWNIEGSATVNGTPVRTRRLARAKVIPIFQYALYYEGDMHFFYPAPMTIRGPVQCNGDVYLYGNTGLTFDTNSFRVAGDVLGQPKFADWLTAYPWGDPTAVNVRKWVANPFDSTEPHEYGQLESVVDLDALGISSTGGFDADFGGWDGNGDGLWDHWSDVPPFATGVFDKFGAPTAYVAPGAVSTLQTQAHGVSPVTAPELADLDAFTPDATNGDFYYDDSVQEWLAVPAGTGTHVQGSLHGDADLVLMTKPDGSWQAFDAAGTDVTATLAPAVSIVSTYDARQAEGTTDEIQMAVVDLDLVASLGLFPANGLLYSYGTAGGTGAELAGFQFGNGANLAGDLTLASPDAIYVQGDFNTISDFDTAVMADAVNLLSNSWDNSKSSGSLPAASETTFNTSILTGDVLAEAAAFNGGPHNLVRMHEAWSGVNLNIEGSLVCLGPSQRATGAFAVYGDFYTAPNRNWSFDLDLTDPNRLPPFTPKIVEIETLLVW